MEIWKDISGFEGLYRISNLGNVYSLKTNKLLKNCIGTHGYYMVYLCGESGKTIAKQVHRLIAQEFIPNPNNKPCIDHLNAIRTDNSIENLKWCTVRENNNNPIFKNRVRLSHIGKKLSERSIAKRTAKQRGQKKNCPINNAKSKAVRQISINNGVIIKEYPSLMEIYRQCGYSPSNIGNCCNGKRLTAYGYVWKYIQDMGEKPLGVGI